MSVSAWNRSNRSTGVVSPCEGDWRETTNKTNGLNNAEPIGLALISCGIDVGSVGAAREPVLRLRQRPTPLT